MKDRFYQQPEFLGFDPELEKLIKDSKEFYRLDKDLETLSTLQRDIVRHKKLPLNSSIFKLEFILFPQTYKQHEIVISLYHIGDGIEYEPIPNGDDGEVIPTYFDIEHKHLLLKKSYILSMQSDLQENVYLMLHQLNSAWERYKMFLIPGKYQTATGEHYCLTVQDLLSYGYSECIKRIDNENSK